ncbi:MAG: hypothetical protein PHG82_01565 [Candidatus Gracilibacteria bacterium]|nr:hypothetical protein [Candidatus Gracilibacteria bacterium]
MNLLTRAIKRMFGGKNTPIYINSDDKWEIYPNKYMLDNGETQVSHIALTDKYPDAEILVDYFNLDPKKVVFFVRTNKVYIPYSNPIAILNDMDESAGAIFIDPQNGMSFETYLYNVSLPVDVYSYGRDMSDTEFFGRRTLGNRRCELNSIFHSLPTEISLLQSMFGNGTREIAPKLLKYLSKLEVTGKNSPIFYSLVFADKAFRENLKAFEGKYRDLKQKATSSERVFHPLPFEFSGSKGGWEKCLKYANEGIVEDVLDEKKLFDSIAEIFPEFAKIWEIEKRRAEFISANALQNWFSETFPYIRYNEDSISSRREGKTVTNAFRYLLYALDELYDGFLPAVEKGEFDFSQKPYPGCQFGTSRAKPNDISRFFEITHILDGLNDEAKISFVNMSSEKAIRDQIDTKANIIIMKLPVIYTENLQIKCELEKKAEESFYKGLKTLEIEAKVYCFGKTFSDLFWSDFFV